MEVVTAVAVLAALMACSFVSWLLVMAFMWYCRVWSPAAAVGVYAGTLLGVLVAVVAMGSAVAVDATAYSGGGGVC